MRAAPPHDGFNLQRAQTTNSAPFTKGNAMKALTQTANVNSDHAGFSEIITRQAQLHWTSVPNSIANSSTTIDCRLTYYISVRPRVERIHNRTELCNSK